MRHSFGTPSHLCDEPVTCPLVLIQEFYSNMHGIDHFVPHFITRVQGISIPITPQIVANVLRVPRIEFPDYPSCECLRTVSKDELMSAFCKHPSKWGECQFTYCSALQKARSFWTWWWPLYFILSHTTTPLQSLMLVSCYPFFSILPLTSPPTLFCLW